MSGASKMHIHARGGGLAQEKEIHFVCSETKQKYLTGKLSCIIKRGTLVAKLVKIQVIYNRSHFTRAGPKTVHGRSMGRFCSYFLSSIKLDKTSENRKKKDSRENRSNVNKQNSSCLPSGKVVLQMSFAEKCLYNVFV